MTNSQKFRDAKEKVNAARKEAKLVMKQAFKEITDQLFIENPLLTQFSFTCYTPYFNDGDTCTYRVGVDYPGINEEDEEIWGKDNPLYMVSEKVKDCLNNFDEEDYMEMFGDHCKVIVKKDSVEVEEYQHD